MSRAAGLALAIGFASVHSARADEAGGAPCPTGAIPVAGTCRLVSPRHRAWLQRQDADGRLHPWFTLFGASTRPTSGRD